MTDLSSFIENRMVPMGYCEHFEMVPIIFEAFLSGSNIPTGIFIEQNGSNGGDKMLDTKQVIEKMTERGFYESMRSVKNGHEPITITFCTNRLDGTDIACTVHLDKETFKFEWCVPYSINKLSTPDCGSLFNDKHFHQLYRKMLKHVRILHLELQED